MLNSLFHSWMLWTGLGTTFALAALCIMVPVFGTAVGAFLTPIAGAIGNWFALWLGDLATGLRLMLSSVAGIIFCATLIGGSAVVSHWYWPNDDAAVAIAKLHHDFRCSPRETPKKYVTTWYDPWTWFF